MERQPRTAGFWIALLASFVVFGVVGEVVGLNVDSFDPNASSVDWGLFVGAIFLAWLSPVASIAARRSRGDASPSLLVGLAGFAGAFCAQLVASSVRDWSPLPLVSGIAACVAAAALVVFGPSPRKS